MRGHTVVSEQGVQEGAKHTFLGGSHVEGQHGGSVVPYSYHLGSAHQEVQDPVAERCSIPGLGDELGEHDGVER